MPEPIILNEHGKQAGPVGSLRNVWSLGSYDPSRQYLIEVATLEDQSAPMRLPVRSVGKSGLRYYFAADLMFITHPGFECVFPVPPFELAVKVYPVAGGFKGSLVYGDEAIFTTPQFMHSEKAAVEGLARWAEKADKRFVMPEEMVREIERSKALMAAGANGGSH